jgi:SpoVK/Ycf46/Vps4 family AAA+-type ATPase
MEYRKRGLIANTPETMYAKRRTAEWLLGLIKAGITMNDDFFSCLCWAIGNLRPVMKKIALALDAMPARPSVKKAASIAKEALDYPEHRLPDMLEELVNDFPFIEDATIGIVEAECRAASKVKRVESARYLQAGKLLKRTFGLDADSCRLCEFIFIKDSFGPVERYFEDAIEVHDFGNRRRLSVMLGIETPALEAVISDLCGCGIINFGPCPHLGYGINAFWKETKQSAAAKYFCNPISGKALPLGSFGISSEDIAHVKSIMQADSSRPIHILLYGPPGTGKTTFATSLAREMGVKAWSVPCHDDEDEDRRASLAACMHLAAKHEKAFVLLDEADNFLDTDLRSHGSGTNKAWLNELLEEKDSRVIWIVNHVEHIDHAVRRRFAFSLHFDELGLNERKKLWQRILTESRVARRISPDQLGKLVKDYEVPAAVIEKAVCQARELGCDKGNFGETVERVLRAHVTLCHDGSTPRVKSAHEGEYTLDGVCLEGSAQDLLEKCRRADAMYRSSGSLRPGGGSMLFYGPPGTGKTALSRHIAAELERECLVKRASDLISPYVGMSEQNIAHAFRVAENDGAVLVIDEADTFLYSRETAQRSWESSLVNEFLTSLEECRGFCICTTNRADKLDPAAMRRFSFKVPFGYAGPDQAAALYAALLAPLAGNALPESLERELRAMTRLAPGDFHAVRSQHWLSEPGGTSHEELVKSLAREQELKLDREERRIGFL